MDDVSIVFRNRDGTHTGKMYVDDFEVASELAARYRNASHIVDVISNRDEIILRWEEGYPDWKYGEINPIKLKIDPYRFERPEDTFWVIENRQWLLADALCAAFDVITGQIPAHYFEPLANHLYDFGGEDMWPLIERAQTKADEMAEETDKRVWGDAISDWMSDSKHLFVRHQIEHVALTVHTQEFASSKRVRQLGAELADLSARR